MIPFPTTIQVTPDLNKILVVFQNGYLQIYDSNLMSLLFESCEEMNEILGDEDRTSLSTNFDGSRFIGIEAINQNRIRVFSFEDERLETSREFNEKPDKKKFVHDFLKFEDVDSTYRNFDLTQNKVLKTEDLDVQSIKIGTAKLTHIGLLENFNCIISANEKGKVIVTNLENELEIKQFDEVGHLRVTWLFVSQCEKFCLISDELGYVTMYEFSQEKDPKTQEFNDLEISKTKVFFLGAEITCGGISGDGKRLILASLLWNKLEIFSTNDLGFSHLENNSLLVFLKKKKNIFELQDKEFKHFQNEYKYQNSFRIRREFVEFLEKLPDSKKVERDLLELNKQKVDLETKYVIREKLVQKTEIQNRNLQEKVRGITEKSEVLKLKNQLLNKLLNEERKTALQFRSYKKEHQINCRPAIKMSEKLPKIYYQLKLDEIISDNSEYLCFFDLLKYQYVEEKNSKNFISLDIMSRIKVDTTELERIVWEQKKKTKNQKQTTNSQDNSNFKSSIIPRSEFKYEKEETNFEESRKKRSEILKGKMKKKKIKKTDRFAKYEYNYSFKGFQEEEDISSDA